jgi:chromosomal replication initiation ATPase DnaA
VLLVAALVGSAFNLTASQVISGGRRRHILLARRAWIYLLHVSCGLSIARLAGSLRLDRKTIIRAVQHIEDWRDASHADQLMLALEQALASTLAGREICRRIFENK